MSINSVVFSQQVTLKGQYSDLNGNQLPFNSSNSLSIVVFDDNGNRVPVTVRRDIKPRINGDTSQPDEYSVKFQAPSSPNRTVSIRFAASDRETVVIPRILARGEQTLNVVLREATAQCRGCSQIAFNYPSKVRLRGRR